MRNFGMPTLIENQTLEQNIALCRALGLCFVELNMNFPEYQIDKLEDTARFYKQADEAGIYYTLHLDENPGDRASDCGGQMEPAWAEPDPRRGYIITHRCTKCGALRRNKAANEAKNQPDDIALLIALTAKEH